MRKGVVIGVAIAIALVISYSFFILSVSASCAPGEDCSCGNGVVDSGEACDRTASPSGCPTGQVCNSLCTACQSGTPTGCDYDGICEPGRSETAANCADCRNTDSDNDGVQNSQDTCPNTPSGEANNGVE